MTGMGYQQRVKEEKAAAIVEAATQLFFEDGYERTSLARVARTADVSTATLFKRFPTKAALFEAIVRHYWTLEGRRHISPEPGDLRAALRQIGGEYAALLTTPGMTSLFRTVIAETPRFPELGRMNFDLGKREFLEGLCSYLRSEQEAGTLVPCAVETAATQFLGMISGQIFWPRLLLTEFVLSGSETDTAVEEAVNTLLARYASPTAQTPRAR